MSHATAHHPRTERGLVAGLVVFVSMMLAAESEAAREREPLAIAFVDATPEVSGPMYDTLLTIVEESDDIASTPPEDFWRGAANVRITRAVLRDDDRREARRPLLLRAMEAQQLEAIVVYTQHEDAFQLVVIGPEGGELERFRAPMRRKRISDRQALKVLEQLFEVLVPEIRRYRQRREKQQPETESSSSATPSSSAASSESTAPREASSSHSSAADALPEVALSLTPMLGRRDLVVTTDDPFELRHGTPFFGARVSAEAGLVSLGRKSRASLGLAGTLDIAGFQTRFPNEEATYLGLYWRARVSGRYTHDVGSRLDLYGHVGAETMRFGLPANETYRGSRYIGGRLGPGAAMAFAQLATLRLESALLPLLGVDTDDGALGPGATTLGIGGLARLTLHVLNPFDVSIVYDVTWLPIQHPNPRDVETAGSGRDLVHVFGLAVGYTF